MTSGRTNSHTEKYTLDSLDVISLFCHKSLHTTGNKTITKKSLEVKLAHSPSMFYIFTEVIWRQQKRSYKPLFTPVFTEEGICYTFNTLKAKDFYNEENTDLHKLHLNVGSRSSWNPEDGFDLQNQSAKEYPYRALGAGLKAGIQITLHTFINDMDYRCKGAIQSYNVLLHNPAEFPDISNQFFHVPMNQTVTVAVRPNMMTTSDGLRSYTPKRRQCFYQSERQLHFFRVYTQSNCYLECVTNYTLEICGCVSFYMPRGAGTEICGSGNRNCTEQAQDAMMVADMGVFLKDEERKHNASKVKCNCLPACTELKYDVDISQTDFEWVKYFAAAGTKMSLSESGIGNSQSSLRIFFKENEFITTHRSELYGSTDFLASCGGLLGLFLGFSNLSLVEMVYYCILVCCNLLKNRFRNHV